MAKFTLEKTSKTARFAGIDFHKTFSLVTLGDKHGEEILQQKLWHNDVQSIKKFFKEHDKVTCAIESCRGHEWFLDLLRDLGLVVHMCNPVKMKVICQTAFKNDKIDSRKIMELLARNYLPTSYQATVEERHVRERVRWRANLVRKGTAIRNAIKALLAKNNISIKDVCSKNGRQKLTEEKMSKAHRALLADMFESLDYNDQAVAAQTKWLEQHFKKDKRVSLLKTIPGFGNISAVAFVAEVGDVSRFKNPSQLSSYFGLVPRLSESADKRRQGGITKTGSSELRWLLVQDAWSAVRKSPELRKLYLSLTRRRGKQIAIVSIARKLAEIAFCVLRDRKPFSESRLCPKD